MVIMNESLDPNKRDIPNTWLPRCESKMFSINGLIVAMNHGFCHVDDFPPDVRQRVWKELARRNPEMREMLVEVGILDEERNCRYK